jgi:hypothetical protein
MQKSHAEESKPLRPAHLVEPHAEADVVVGLKVLLKELLGALPLDLEVVVALRVGSRGER